MSDQQDDRVSIKCSHCGQIATGRWRWVIDDFEIDRNWYCDECDRRHRMYSMAMFSIIVVGVMIIAILVWL